MTLVDIAVPTKPISATARLIWEWEGGKPAERIAEGVYLVGGHNFNHILDEYGIIKSEYPFDEWSAWREVMDMPRDSEEDLERNREAVARVAAMPKDYGVCDDWTQIIERWPEILTDPRRLIITVTEVRRDEQPSDGGWRWHKWGEYIGTHEPQYEYLYDEEDIDRVFCFHIHEVN